MTAKVLIRMEQIARFRMAGLKDARIASLVGLTPAGFARIVALSEYKELEESVLLGTVNKLDEALAGRANEIHKAFQIAVPAAMRTLVEAVTQRRDLRAAIEASKEILDRDPQRVLSKGRIGVTIGDSDTPRLPQELLDTVSEDADKVKTQVVRETIQ